MHLGEFTVNEPAGTDIDSSSAAKHDSEPYRLRFAHNVIEHLGHRLYQNRPTNVLAELVSNAWDADAAHVWISLEPGDTGPKSIAVADDGIGMNDPALRQEYLVVGRPKRGDSADPRTPGGRKPMGRKGIGKLAPFGVAKTLDLITVRDGLVTWLRFDYDHMIAQQATAEGTTDYRPSVLAKLTPIADVDRSKAEWGRSALDSFLAALAAGHGTLVIASRLTLQRTLSSEAIMQSLGRRFTVTLARPDFEVFVDGQKVEEKFAFPQWELRIPPTGAETELVQTPYGPKEVRCWAGFVKEASWSQEEAGVGVYAHGKIAQDRPFFFGNKGNEVFSRYMYGVVEADWIDELDRDTISTDRSSVDWDDDALQAFHKWGLEKVRAWIRTYEKHRQSVSRAEGQALVETVTREPRFSLRPSEKEHVVDLLSEVMPKLARDPDERSRFVAATVRAWVHEPARRLINRLWKETAEFDADKFASTINRLADELVPESLSLAVVFSQRVYALTQLENHIMRGMETQLQKLVEEFPWILDQGYVRFNTRQSLKTICEQAVAAGLSPARKVHFDSAAHQTKPDFVFFADADEADILVVELKGPRETASWDEFEQLHSYTSYLGRARPSSTIKGILVAGNHDASAARSFPHLECLKWGDVLLRSRRAHMELLAALLAGADADANDSRVQLVCELGGEPVRSFLEQMAENEPRLREIVAKLTPNSPVDAAASTSPAS
jgi:hypothetical protein